MKSRKLKAAMVMLCAGLVNTGLANDSTVENQMNGILAAKFAGLALDCVHREYPNKIGHVLNSDEDARTPLSLHPVFYGCFDWHSSVHGHWLLVRLLRRVPAEQFPAGMRGQVVAALQQSFNAEGVAEEVAYFQTENRKSYERPYGVAWFLQLTAELRGWQDPLAIAWLETIHEALILAATDKYLTLERLDRGLVVVRTVLEVINLPCYNETLGPLRLLVRAYLSWWTGNREDARNNHL